MQKRHNRVLFSDEESAQFVEYNGIYYRDDWLRYIEDGAIELKHISIIRIEEDEYNSLKEQLDDGNLPHDISLENEVAIVVDNPADEEPVIVQKTVAQILEEQIKLAARFAEV